MEKKKLTKTVATLAAIAALGAGVGIGAIASADTTASATTATTAPAATKPAKGGFEFGSGVFGKVTTVSGTTLTVAGGKDGATSYTVDISSAKVTKSTSAAPKPAAATASDIAVGDQVAIRGTVNGTSVTATEVMDGMTMHRGGRSGPGGRGVHGSVTAVNGSSITITDKDGTSYTVDATKADLTKVVTISTGDVKVGDTLNVQGTVSGTSVTATHIMDGAPKPANATAAN